jgi:hypothetical protein
MSVDMSRHERICPFSVLRAVPSAVRDMPELQAAFSAMLRGMHQYHGAAVLHVNIDSAHVAECSGR